MNLEASVIWWASVRWTAASWDSVSVRARHANRYTDSVIEFLQPFYDPL